MSYDLTVLDPTEFEALVGDLLSKSWGSRLESFKAGQDGGIDLRHSRMPENDPTTIVQCKRYATNAFARLAKSCEKERPKLDKLEPERYVLVTTVPLSPANKDKLIAVLAPWCSSPADIYGPDELNGFLRAFPEVERAHFKLWISSTTVLERVLHAGVFSLTEATLEEARHQLSTLVVHDGLQRAHSLLRDQHHVMIVGNPGIGKTTLARMLVCHYLAQGFEPAWVLSDIRDAWNIIRGNDARDQRLIVVYDDFLGRLRFESPRFEKNEDVSLFALVAKVERSANLRLILTTREYILEDAKGLHGSFDERADALLKCVLSLEDYSLAHRARMVFNHLYFSDLPQARIERFVETKAYRFVVNHRNFNPRIVESISKYANSRARSDDEFIAFVEEECDNPAKLWEHPFQHEISPLGRQILFALWTFNGVAEADDLREAVLRTAKAAVDAEFRREFDVALKQIEGNFVIINRYELYGGKGASVHVVGFQNPSIEEFVERKITRDPSWLESVGPAVLSLQQAEQVLRHIDEGARQRLSPQFWASIRKSGKDFDRRRVGQVQRLTFGVSEKAVAYWHRKLPTAAQAIRARLEIDARAGVEDRDAKSIRARVLTASGWKSIIAELDGDENVTTHSLQLQRWIVCSSGWVADDKSTSEHCLREAVLQLFRLGDVWFWHAASVVAICQSVTLINAGVDKELREALIALAVRAADRVLHNEDEPDVLRSEAESLIELSRMLSCPVSPLSDELLNRAMELEVELEVRQESDADCLPHAEEIGEGIDIDQLFAGLLDR